MQEAADPVGPSARRRAWIIVGGVLLATVMVPFALWGDALEERTRELGSGTTTGVLLAAAVVGLLAADIALPVPSSTVMVLAGVRFGFVGGTALSWLGSMIGCLVAYELGQRFGPSTLRRLVGRAAADAVSATTQRRGAFALPMCRAVPVLAEASVILAGASNMPRRRFVVSTAVGNAVVAGVYAGTGDTASGAVSLLVALSVTAVLPGVVLFGDRYGRRGRV